MKKNFLLSLILVSFSLFVAGQSQRLVLLEQFTQASCGPCADWNPTITTLINDNPEKITSINYHVSWPGYDPMYNHYPSGPSSKVSYYGISSVPHSVLDGNFYSGYPSGWNIGSVNTRYNVPSPLNIQLTTEVIGNTVEATMLVEATDNVSGNLKAYMAIVEKHIHFNSPPGSNGETDFYNVLIKLLPKNTGATIPSSLEVGDYIILQYSWEYSNVYNLDEVAAIGFVQNYDSKEIHQSANSINGPIIPLYSNDAEITEISNISASNCVGHFDPVIVLRNNGSDALTSANITYTINNGEAVTYQWTGNLAFLESETITLDEANFTVLDDNTVDFEIENPNGQVDDYPSNNIKSIGISKGVEAASTILLILQLDDNPEETTWEFTNSLGEMIYEGGPYSTPGEQIFEEYEFSTTDCYTFNIYDAAGNGLDGGTFAIGFGSTIIVQGSDFGSKAEGQFQVLFTGVDELAENTGISVYPNPVGNMAFVSFDLQDSETVDLNVYNSLGEIVYKVSNETYTKGNHILEINTSQLMNGVYYVKLNYGENSFQEKIIVTK